jgi:Holliday junction resolvase-like predicted endonuclease
MSGAAPRAKGKRAESEAARLLADRDWSIIELGPGRKTEDVVAMDPDGVLHSVEVKNHLCWHLIEWRRQAKEQARRRKARWLLMVRIPDMPGAFYVEGSAIETCVWRGRAA